jgi:transcriptional regulator with GAF, ATPase, and Fis domain
VAEKPADATAQDSRLAGQPVPAKLVVIAGPEQGREIALDGTVQVGTDAACHLVLTDARVSRRHASFARVGGRVVVKDHDSRNGTFLGGARISEAEVPLGSVIHLGRGTAVAVQPRWYVREVPPSTHRHFGDLLGESVAMREVFAILERVAATDATLLVEGETGTGKEVAARSVHAASLRAPRPYVTFNCSAVPRDLAESELFGHRRGAFSGAVADRAGAFVRAHGGTIFLDEIGEMPLDLQPKLLRALETGEVRSVGDDLERKVDVRVIAATNRDLFAEAARGTFRQDLLYRLDVVRVRLPPLRHRPQDVPQLVAHFLEGRVDPKEGVGGDNLARLLGYAWPGNVRELRNVLLRAVALAGASRKPRFSELVLNLGPVTPAPLTLGFAYPGTASLLPYKEAKQQLVAGFERAYVEALLERHQGNKSEAARAAGLSRKHLGDLFRRTLGQDDPDSGSD